MNNQTFGFGLLLLFIGFLIIASAVVVSADVAKQVDAPDLKSVELNCS